MQIAIDVREACREIRTGKGQWTYGFVTALLGKNLTLILLTDSPLPREWSGHPTVTEKRIAGHGLQWHLAARKFLQSADDIGLFLSSTSYIIPALGHLPMPCVVFVHDLIAFRSEPHQFKARWIERLTLGRAVRHAAHICTISESTTRDLRERYPHVDAKKVTPIFAGPFDPHPSMNVPDGMTILCVGTLSPRKNQMRLIQAYASLPSHLRERFSLVLAGARGWKDDNIVTFAQSTPGVTWKGYINADEYNRLLGTCTLLALPSLYEGFGMQILDALQRGVPVLTSQKGSVAEVAGDAAIYADPLEVTSIASGLQKLLDDQQWRDRLRQAGPLQAARFSWAKTASLFLDAVQPLL